MMMLLMLLMFLRSQHVFLLPLRSRFLLFFSLFSVLFDRNHPIVRRPVTLASAAVRHRRLYRFWLRL